jgi:hypothetical protein
MLGGWGVQQYQISSSFMEVKGSKAITQQAGIAFANYIAEAGGGGSTSGLEDWFSNATTFQSSFFGGIGSPSPKGNSWSQWAATIPKVPFLTGFTLAPVSDLLPNGPMRSEMSVYITDRLQRTFIEDIMIPSLFGVIAHKAYIKSLVNVTQCSECNYRCPFEPDQQSTCTSCLHGKCVSCSGFPPFNLPPFISASPRGCTPGQFLPQMPLNISESQQAILQGAEELILSLGDLLQHVPIDRKGFETLVSKYSSFSSGLFVPTQVTTQQPFPQFHSQPTQPEWVHQKYQVPESWDRFISAP